LHVSVARLLMERSQKFKGCPRRIAGMSSRHRLRRKPSRRVSSPGQARQSGTCTLTNTVTSIICGSLLNNNICARGDGKETRLTRPNASLGARGSDECANARRILAARRDFDARRYIDLPCACARHRVGDVVGRKPSCQKPRQRPLAPLDK